MAYLHGAYGKLGDSIVQQVITSETIPVYIGTAPVGLVADPPVNVPVKIESMADAQKKLGYNDDFGSYTLCEAVAAHFGATASEGVGPIYVINVLDPATDRASSETTKDVTFSGGSATVYAPQAILSTLAVKDAEGSKTYTEGEDYTAEYVYQTTGDHILVTAIEGGEISDGAAKVTFTEMDPTAVTASDVVGGLTSAGVYSGIKAVDLVYQQEFVVPNILAAPGWSDDPAVYKALVEESYQINGHWNAMVAVDVPLVDAESQLVDTIDKAVAWKKENLYNSERAIACWPMATDEEGRTFHISTLFVAESQKVDQDNNGIPFESPSNKAVPVIKQYFGENSQNMGFDQQTGNGLNEAGITTVIGWAGEWVLWGPHTAAYAYDDPTVDPRAIFATNMRMLFHITNSFQQEWSPLIDSPMTRQLRDRIINREQEKLDGYVTIGALLGAPKVYFLESENPTTNLMNGDFVWDIVATPTPPLKSATAYVSYTDEGFMAYFGEV